MTVRLAPPYDAYTATLELRDYRRTQVPALEPGDVRLNLQALRDANMCVSASVISEKSRFKAVQSLFA